MNRSRFFQADRPGAATRPTACGVALLVFFAHVVSGCSSETRTSGHGTHDSGASESGTGSGGGSAGGSQGHRGGSAGASPSGGGGKAGGVGQGGSGGSTADGSVSGAGGSGAGAGGATDDTMDAALPHVVGKCDALGAPGKWEQISPTGVSLDPNFNTPAGTNFGDHSFVIDPQNSAHLYLGTSAQGIYESNDCGATWKKVDTGRNADKLDGGRQWTFVIDPVDPKVLYANAGYGSNNAYKSTNGGVDWDVFIDPAYAAALQFGGFVASITMDPTDHRHLIVTPHFECEIGMGPGGLPKTKACLIETKDAGATWAIHEGTPSGGESAGQWMIDSKLWFWAEGFTGLWRTDDGGASWQHVYDAGYATSHGVHLPGAPFYTGGVFGTLTSADDGKTWSSVDGAPGTDFLVGDAKDLFGSRNAGYWTTSAQNPAKWTELPSPPFANPDGVRGWGIKYDPDHRLLYSLNSTDGFFRMVVP